LERFTWATRYNRFRWYLTLALVGLLPHLQVAKVAITKDFNIQNQSLSKLTKMRLVHWHMGQQRYLDLLCLTWCVLLIISTRAQELIYFL
jgi:hypothetical protein